VSQITVEEQGIVSEVMAAVPAMSFADLQAVAWGLRELPGADRYDGFQDPRALRVVTWMERGVTARSEGMLARAEAFVHEDTFRFFVHISETPDDLIFVLPRAIGERMCQLGRPGLQ
jgi:hypothetical protein